MHLLVLAEDFYPSVSGGAHEAWRFTQIATERGHAVSVVTPRKPDTVASEVVDDVKIARPFPATPEPMAPTSALATGTRLAYTATLFAWIQWWARNRSFDAVYSASNTHHWVGTALGRLWNVPSVSYVGYTPSMRPAAQSSARLALERLNFTYGLGDQVFCRVPEIRDLIRERSGKRVELVQGILNDERIQAAHNRAECEDIRSEYADPDERLLVVAGRLSEEKNVCGAVEVLHELPATYRLAVLGDGPEREAVEAAVDRLGERERVSVAGQRSHEETLATIAVADGLLLPSHVETYPTVAFEGLALGCSVFTTPVGILTETDHPRLFTGPVDELAATITEVDPTGSTAVDEDTLEQYSMDRFADTVLGALGG